MSRLAIQAVSGESKFVDIVFHLELFVSVSFADSGLPVSGLQAQHFQLCAPSGKVFDTTIATCTETQWGNHSGEGAGCYELGITIAKGAGHENLAWLEGEYYPFGIQARFSDDSNHVHTGQTVVRVQSLGK
jgi:hypothetical protein